MLKTTSGNIPQGPGLPSAISTAVLQVRAEANVFESLNVWFNLSQ